MMNGQYPSPADDERGELDDPVPLDDALDALLAEDAGAWRATLPAEELFAARMVAVLRDPPLSTSPARGIGTAEDDRDEIRFVREPIDEPDSSRRDPLRLRRVGRGRGLLAVGAMAAVVAVLVVVIQVFAPLREGYLPPTPTRVVSAKPPITLPGGAWQQIALPVASAKWGDYAVSPTDPATIYACFSGATPAASSGLTISTVISIWVTHDTGRHWSTVGLPLSGGSACQLSIARGAPRRVGVLLAGDASLACGSKNIYLSDDGGAHWRSIPYQPISTGGAAVPSCTLTVTSDALYMSSSWLTGDPANGGVQLSAWQRTTDDGKTWQRLDTAFGAQTLFRAWEIGTGDSFIASVLPVPNNPGSTLDGALWITHDGGTRWQRLGPLPLGVDLFVLPAPSPGLSGASAAQPFYALRGEQVPPDTFILAAYQSGDGRAWAQLPPLPVPGATSQRSGMTNVLGVDAAGRLYTFGVDPAHGVPPQSAQQELNQMDQSRQWLWVWDPSAARWEQLATPLDEPWPPFCGALCWHGSFTPGPAGASYLWVDVLGGDYSVTPALYRVLVP